ncbi:MAG: hypothetical protein ACE149_05860 [Armatimonadota bacterium]
MRILIRLGWLKCCLVCAALSIAAGCAKPSAPPEQFVGTWIVPLKPSGELRPGAAPTLTLAPDGTGIYTEYPDPHPMNVSWVLRGSKLVLANRDGSGSMTYGYRFKGKDELVLAMPGGEVSFKRHTGQKSRGAEESKSRRDAPP